MENKNLTAEYMFGKDYLENLQQLRLSEFANDKVTLSLFNSLCEDISHSTITDYELINIIKVTPHVIGFSIIHNIKNRDREKLFSSLQDCYYNEFIRDVKDVDENGVSAFEKRFEKISIKNIKTFVDERILTREELELLIRNVVKKSNLEDRSYFATHEKYDGDNKYLKLLVKAHNSLTKIRSSQTRREILQKVKVEQLQNIIYKIKEYDKTFDL